MNEEDMGMFDSFNSGPAGTKLLVALDEFAE